MATLLSTIRTRARKTLLEETAGFWTDAELLEHIVEGVKDLWGAIIDLHQEHFVTTDVTNVSVAANATSLTGVPADVFRVLTIEPRDLTNTASSRGLLFVKRDYHHPEFVYARSLSAIDPSDRGLIIYYTIDNPGAPVAAPTIQVAPKLSSAVNLRLRYIPTLAASDMEAGDSNPIPGESDNALYAWCIAYGRAKEREDRSPDPNWLTVYATEKENVKTRLTPRDESEPEVAEGMFDGWGNQ